MRKRLLLVALTTGLALLSLLSQPEQVAAHPLGNFTVNRYSRIELSPERMRVRYVLDMAEIPTFQAMPTLDADRNGIVSEAEKHAYAARRLDELSRNLRLTLDGAAVPLRVASQELELLPGQGGLQTMRLSAWLEASLGPVRAGAASVHLEYRDDNEPGRIGWREIVVRPTDGIAVQSPYAPTRDVSDELRSYPEDLLSSPLDVRQLRITFALGAGSATGAPAGADAAGTVQHAARVPALARVNDGLAELLATGTLTLPIILVALLTAMVLGGMHAMSPGHGKTIVGAYLVGSRGTARHALFLGLVVTATHTAGVFALGLATLYASQYVLPERVYPWLGLLSGLLVVAIGASLVNARLRAAGWALTGWATTHGDHLHRHGFLALAHRHDHDDRHEHRHNLRGSAVGRRGVPSTQHSAPAHSHGLGSHSHAVPGPDGAPVTWRSLLALGISGGLLPCPSALIVMLGAIALHRVAFGLVLIVAFSIGLATTLVTIGLLMVYSGRALGRLRLVARLGAGDTGVVGTASRLATLLRLLPVASAAAVSLAGLALTVEAARHLDLLGLVASARLWQTVAGNAPTLLLFVGLTLLSTLLLTQRSISKWTHRV